jgi:Cu-Zn family superoxide dismutase
VFSLRFLLAVPLALLAAAFLWAQEAVQHSSHPAVVTAQAELKDREGNHLGTVRLAETPAGVLIRVEAQGLEPGPLGFHVHEHGACEPPAFESAGDHFNPAGKQHGFKHPEGPHAGDLVNLIVAEDGTVRVEFLAENLTLTEGANALLREGGTALVIHEGPDDYRTDPSGSAGGRLACGVIQREQNAPNRGP